MSLATIVFIIFLVLKLLGIGVVATWSWWLVTLPLWIGFAIWAALMLFGAGVFGVLAIFTGKRKSRSKYRF
jgi:hypothetical protein